MLTFNQPLETTVPGLLSEGYTVKPPISLTLERPIPESVSDILEKARSKVATEVPTEGAPVDDKKPPQAPDAPYKQPDPVIEQDVAAVMAKFAEEGKGGEEQQDEPPAADAPLGTKVEPGEPAVLESSGEGNPNFDFASSIACLFVVRMDSGVLFHHCSFYQKKDTL